MSDLSSIFVHSHCVSKTQLLDYIRQKLDKEETHLVESHINDCQFCNDALDALLEADLIQVEKDLAGAKSELNKTLFPVLQVAATPIPKENNVRDFEISRKNFKRFLAAASVLLIIGLGGYSVFSFINDNKKEIAKNEKGKGDSKYDAEYSTKDDEHDEIVRLNVEENDTFRKYAESEYKTSKNKEDITTSGQVTAPAKTVTNETAVLKNANEEEKIPAKALEDKVAEAVQAPPVVANDNTKIDPAPGMENYARDNRSQKVQPEVTKEVNKKKSAGGMKYDNIVSSPQTNQMNYPRTNNNDNLQRNNDYGQRNVEAVIGQTQESYKDEESKELSNFEKGMDNFNKKNYKKSISFFEKALKKATGTEREDILYHLALAYENTGKTEKANEIYASLSKSKKYAENAELRMKEAAKTKK